MYFGSRGATKFTSFTRRLKRWKFTRISKGPQLGAYYHEYFVKDKPDLLKMIVYPGAKAKPGTKSPSKSNIKVKISNKARRRASTGSLSRPVTVGSRSTSTPVIDDFIPTPVVDPFDVAINSISAPMQDDMLDISDTLDISPMPIKKTLKISSEFLTKDFPNWLSDTAFGDNDPNSQLAHRLLSSPIEPASVVSNSSHLQPPPMSNPDLPVTVGVRRSKSKLPRRHSCIASIHSTTPSYNVPLNDVGATASKNSGSMPTTTFPSPSTSTSSYNRGMTDDNSLPSANNTQNWPATVPKVMQQQIQQKLQQQTQQQFVIGSSQSQVGQPVVEQRLQQMQQQLQQQMQQQFQQQQQQPRQQTQLQHFVGGLSAHATTVADRKQQQQPTQSELQSPRSSFQDELDDFFRFSKEREFTLDDILNDSH